MSEQNNLTTSFAECICGCSPILVMFSDQSTPALCKVRLGLAETRVQCPPFLSVPEQNITGYMNTRCISNSKY